MKDLKSMIWSRPWCGDEECGYISVKINREGDLVIWKDFRLEPDTKQIHVGPFYFEWEPYQRAIRDTLGMEQEL